MSKGLAPFLVSLISLSVLAGCSDSDQRFKAEVDDVRRVLGLDCRNLPTPANKLHISFIKKSGDFDVFNVDGMLVEVSSVDFGPNMYDSVSMALNDSWDCGGIVHDRSETESPYTAD